MLALGPQIPEILPLRRAHRLPSYALALSLRQFWGQRAAEAPAAILFHESDLPAKRPLWPELPILAELAILTASA